MGAKSADKNTARGMAPITKREYDEMKESLAMMARSLSTLVAVYEQLAERETGAPVVYPSDEPADEDIL